jgi:hypothetical protein
MIETKNLPCVLPLPVSSRKQVLLWSFVRSLSGSFPPSFPSCPCCRTRRWPCVASPGVPVHSLRVHVVVPVVGPVSRPLVSPSIPFVSMSSYPSSALCRVPWCPRPLAPPIHPASSCSQQWWWVLVRGESWWPALPSSLLLASALQVDARSGSLLLLVGGSAGVGALVG